MSDVPTRPDAPIPDAYAAFTPVLERLSQPMLHVLRGQLEQFERLDLDLLPALPAPRGHFEGFGGLARRGDLSHIVESELLLRSEAPLEFLRRLAEGESLFLEKQYVDPGLRPVYRVMISAGPGVLGHGRMVALAALIFMARLAAARGGDLHWCFLPRAEGAVWFDEVSVNTVKRFLRAASYREMGLEDMDEAIALWAGLMKDSVATPALKPVDWVIGARPWRADPATARPQLAVEGAANTVAFVLAPALVGAPRTIELHLRRARKDLTRATFVLPDDTVCAQALKSPLRPPQTAPGGAGLPVRRREPEGWAPQYFAVASEKVVVRTRDGLFILAADRKGAVLGRWFAAFPPETQLAGFRMHQSALSILVQRMSNGADTLGYGRYGLGWNNTPTLLEARHVAQAASSHLFRKQPAYSLPTITTSGVIRFHSPSGHPFQLTPSATQPTMDFAPLYKEPKLLHSTGVHEVIAIPIRDERLFRVLRAGRERLRDYQGLTKIEAKDDVVRVSYSHAEETLAYSCKPHQWFIADHSNAAPTAGPETFTLKPYEVLLTSHRRGTRVTLRIWSDAAHGGAGEIQTIRFGDRAQLHRHPLVKLGEDALNIARIAYANDGSLWAMTVDDQGAPSELLNYRRRKGDKRDTIHRFDLAELVKGAASIDLGLLDA